MADEMTEPGPEPGPLFPQNQKTFSVLEMEHHRPTSFSHVYSNNASFGITFFDLSITFGEVLVDGPNAMHVEDRVTVTMSVEHAKALANALEDVLTNYEKGHGPIRKAQALDEI
jgi:hypothetical protein